MTTLPPGQSAILGGGFSPWQVPLAALFSGLSAAGQPGGWQNFGMGVQQGAQTAQGNMFRMEQQQRAREQFQMEQERFKEDQRRANQEEAERQARLDAIRNLLPQPGGMQTASGAPQDFAGIPPHARQSAILSAGVDADMSAQGGATPQTGGQAAMFSGLDFTPQQAALFSQYAQADPDAAFSLMMQRAFAEQSPNQTRTRHDGNFEIMEEFDPATGEWSEVSRGPRWQQGGGQSLTERQRNAAAAGLLPGTPEYQRYILGQDEEGGGPFAGNALDAQAMNMLLEGDPASPEYAAAFSHLAQPKVTLDPQTNKLVVISPDLSWARPPVSNAGSMPPPQPTTRPGPTVENALGLGQQQPAPTMPTMPGAETFQVPGATVTSAPGGVKMSPEEATKFTALEEGTRDIQAAMDLLAPGGRVNEMSVATGQSFFGMQGVPLSEGKRARQQMQRGIEGILRAMTGAAAPESEVERYMDMFFPSPTDTDAAAIEKMEKARAWAQGVVQQMKVGRPQLQGGPAPAPTLPSGGRRVDTLPEGNWR